MTDIESPAPNLAKLVGSVVCSKLLSEAGSLLKLSMITPSTLCHLGRGGVRAIDQHFHAGFILESPLLSDYFGDVSTAPDQRAVRKAAEWLAKKASLAIHVDLVSRRAQPNPSCFILSVNPTPPLLVSTTEFADRLVKEAKEVVFPRFCNSGKTSAEDDVAFDVPLVFVKGVTDSTKQRGGRKVQQQQLRKRNTNGSREVVGESGRETGSSEIVELAVSSKSFSALGMEPKNNSDLCSILSNRNVMANVYQKLDDLDRCENVKKKRGRDTTETEEYEDLFRMH